MGLGPWIPVRDSQPWRLVDPPGDYGWTPPVQVWQRGGVYRATPDIATFAPAGGTAYYVDVATGNNLNGGTGWGDALKGIKYGIQKVNGDAGATTIYVKAGTYAHGGDGWDQYANTRSFSAIAVGGRVLVSGHTPGLAWAADTAPRYKASTALTVSKIRDTTNLDAYGNYTPLTLVANAAAVLATPNSWYQAGAGADIYIRTFDDRDPGATETIRCYVTASRGGYNRRDLTVYVENFDFEGFYSHGMMTEATAGYARPSMYLKNCTAKYTCVNTQNGFYTAGGLAVYQNCVAAANGNDGFNPTEGTGLALYAPQQIEVACVGRDNGTAGGSAHNGSTCHKGGKTLRIGCEYMRNIGRNVHDTDDAGVGDRTRAWALGCVSHDSAYPGGGAIDGNWSVRYGTMWLDGCTSYGSTTALEEDTNGVLYIRACTYTGAVVGTPEAY